MASASSITRFASAERASPQTVEQQSQLFLRGPFPHGSAGVAFGAIMVLNGQRQIVFCNAGLADMLGVDDPLQLLGRRPGEALDCIHAGDMPGGCGTSDHCSMCGAVLAVLACQGGRPETRECRLLRGGDLEALDLQVQAMPLKIGGEPFTMVAVADISHEKRRQALERVFFHDIMNTAMGLLMQAEHVARRAPESQSKVTANVYHGLHRLVEEISSHRDLMAAERRELVVRPLETRSGAMLDEAVRSYSHLAESRGCRIETDRQIADVGLHTDVSILLRVLANMLKNAIEACQAGQTVTIGCGLAEGGVEFWVHNPGVIAHEVQLQLFKRSFSTKGAGRGLGTYSMKLLTERYLGGRVSFTTSPEEGTRFVARCPLRMEA